MRKIESKRARSRQGEREREKESERVCVFVRERAPCNSPIDLTNALIWHSPAYIIDFVTSFLSSYDISFASLYDSVGRVSDPKSRDFGFESKRGLPGD